MEQIVHGVSCLWGKVSMERNVHGGGKMSIEQNVIGRVVMGRVVQVASCDEKVVRALDSQNGKAGTGQPEWDSQSRTSRTGRRAQHRTVRTIILGQGNKRRTAETGQLG